MRPVKKLEWWCAGMVICLELGADLHMAQLTPLPLTVSCFSKIQISFTFLVPAHPGSHCVGAHPLCGALSQWGLLEQVKPAYNQTRPYSQLKLTASTPTMDQYASSPGYSIYCYAEVAAFFINFLNYCLPSSGFYGAVKDNRGRCTANPSEHHTIQTISFPTSIITHGHRKMLTCIFAYLVAWLATFQVMKTKTNKNIQASCAVEHCQCLAAAWFWVTSCLLVTPLVYAESVLSVASSALFTNRETSLTINHILPILATRVVKVVL